MIRVDNGYGIVAGGDLDSLQGGWDHRSTKKANALQLL